MNGKNEYWSLSGSGIRWDIAGETRLPHKDHVEMSGKFVSQHISYQVRADKSLEIIQTVVWPGLRLIPNDTHASMQVVFEGKSVNPEFIINGRQKQVSIEEVAFDGILSFSGSLGDDVQILYEFYPGGENRLAFLCIQMENRGDQQYKLNVLLDPTEGTARGVYGINYYFTEIQGDTEFSLFSGEKKQIFVCYGGRLWADSAEDCNGWREYKNRRHFVTETTKELDLETPDPMINRLFAFAKIRSSESVFQTRAGLLHSPGGLHYYGAVWTNDQIEYAGPFFTYLGRENPIQASLNAYRMYIPFMGPGYECIPSSIIAEGNDIWEGKGDRGDCAMYAYGASRFALSLGKRAVAEELYPAIVWCLEYSKRKCNEDGVICSDSDELEGRFPAGTANLSTSCLVYEALRMAIILAGELGDKEHRREYVCWRNKLGENIERFFGKTLRGYETYRYCDGSDALRAWICIPLTVGIHRRKEGTIRALLSEYLWTEDGLASMEGDAIFWDRSTLYGLRGIFCAGEAEKGLKYLKAYSERRLLGAHVPYPVEAYPEGNQRHLSAESALYCRIFIEGILGISPEGLDRFSIHPCLPQEWSYLRIRNIHGYGTVFDLAVEREDCAATDGYTIYINEKDGKGCRKFKVVQGESLVITFENLKYM